MGFCQRIEPMKVHIQNKSVTKSQVSDPIGHRDERSPKVVRIPGAKRALK